MAPSSLSHGKDEEESLVSSGAEAAADVCKCCVWLLGPCGDSPFKRSNAEYLSAVAFWGGRDHWAHSLNILGTRPPACHCGLGSSSVRPSPSLPKLEAQREPTFNQLMLFVYMSRADATDVFTSKKRRWQHFHFYLSERSHRSVFILGDIKYISKC